MQHSEQQVLQPCANTAWCILWLISLPWSVAVLGSRRPFLLPAAECSCSSTCLHMCGPVQILSPVHGHEQGTLVYAWGTHCKTSALPFKHEEAAPTVTLPTSRVPAMDVLTTGMCSDSSASNTLHKQAVYCVSFCDEWPLTPWMI